VNISTWFNKKVIIACVVGALIVATVAFILIRSNGSATPENSDNLSTSGDQAYLEDLSLPGSLVFPNTLELSFSSNGEVGSVNVSEGDSVETGSILATLDDVTVASLEEKVAIARSDVNKAIEALDKATEKFSATPLEQATLDNKIVVAKKTLKSAEENLIDYQMDYGKDLAVAQKAYSDAQSALKTAEELLEDFQRTYQSSLAKARKAKIAAETTLDDAIEKLEYYDSDQAHLIADANKTLATKEAALEAATEDLDNFEVDFDESVADAVLVKTTAQTALDVADDNLLAFHLDPVYDPEPGIVVDAKARAAVVAAYEEALTNFQQSEDELAELENNKDLDKQKLETAVSVAEVEFGDAEKLLKDLMDSVDQALDLDTRQSAVEVARATLAQAEIDLQKELAGPDTVNLNVLEANVADAKSKLANADQELAREMVGADTVELETREIAVALAREELNDLIDGPDRFDVDVKTATLKSKEAILEDAISNLDGANVIAPFDGIISIVNVDVDDKVTSDSLVLEIVDPNVVEVHSIIDASDIDMVNVGKFVSIEIGSDGMELPARVSYVDESARTERGVVTHPVVMSLDDIDNAVIPVTLSSVTVHIKAD